MCWAHASVPASRAPSADRSKDVESEIPDQEKARFYECLLQPESNQRVAAHALERERNRGRVQQAENDEQRQILDVLSADVAVGRPILTAPDVPVERVTALRQAFEETMKDPKFIAAAREANMYFNPMGGEELQRMVDRVLSTSPAVIAKVKDAIKGNDLPRLPGR